MDQPQKHRDWKKPGTKGPHGIWCHFYEICRIVKSIDTERFIVPEGSGEGWNLTANGDRVSFLEDENVLEPGRSGGCTARWMCWMHLNVHFKRLIESQINKIFAMKSMQSTSKENYAFLFGHTLGAHMHCFELHQTAQCSRVSFADYPLFFSPNAQNASGITPFGAALLSHEFQWGEKPMFSKTSRMWGDCSIGLAWLPILTN